MYIHVYVESCFSAREFRFHFPEWSDAEAVSTYTDAYFEVRHNDRVYRFNNEKLLSVVISPSDSGGLKFD